MLESEKNEIILVADEAVIYRQEQGMFPNSEEWNHSIKLLEKTQIENMMSDGYLFPAKYDNGELLIRNPYKKEQYVSITDEDTALLDKLSTIKHIFNLLGAEKFYFEIDKSVTEESDRSLRSDIKVKGWKAGISKKDIASAEFKQKFFDADENNKQSDEQRLRGYEDAKKLIQDTPLKDDVDICNILKERQPGSAVNKISRTYVCELSKEWNQKLDIAASLKYFDPEIFSLDTKIQQEINTKNIISFRYVSIWDWDSAEDVVKDAWKKKYEEKMLGKHYF